MKRTDHRQLSFAFADSPRGGGEGGTPDASGARAFLLRTAKPKRRLRTVADTADTSRLLEDVASTANLAQALLKVIRNQGAPGVDGETVEEAQRNAAPLIAAVRQALLSERYRPGDVRRVWLPKPGGGQRGLGIPNVVDRVVQQAVLQILEPIFEPTFHPSSHGFRPHRGAHTAIAKAKEYLSAGYQMVVDIDPRLRGGRLCRNSSTGSIAAALGLNRFGWGSAKNMLTRGDASIALAAGLR